MMEQNTTNKPLRRVGTLTLGVCLIAAGVLFLLARFLPGLPWLVIWQDVYKRQVLWQRPSDLLLFGV